MSTQAQGWQRSQTLWSHSDGSRATQVLPTTSPEWTGSLKHCQNHSHTHNQGTHKHNNFVTPPMGKAGIPHPPSSLPTASPAQCMQWPSHHHQHTVTSTPSPAHHHQHAITSTPSPARYHQHAITSTPSPAHHHQHTITSTPSPARHHQHAITSTPSPACHHQHTVTITSTPSPSPARHHQHTITSTSSPAHHH